MNTKLETLTVSAAIINYAETLDKLHNEADPTLALAFSRVANRKLLESIEHGAAKLETNYEIAERILDIAKEVAETATK